MAISFEFAPGAARQIYDRVMARVDKKDRPKVDELFESAAGLEEVDPDYALSEAEAQRVEEALNRHDQTMRSALGVRAYDAKEIKATVRNEGKLWEAIIRLRGFEASTIAKTLQKYIKDHPGSPDLPMAYYHLALAYRLSGDVQKAIQTHQKNIKLHPRSSWASGSMRNLIILFYERGEDEAALGHCARWLSHQPGDNELYVHLSFSAENARASVLFFQAEILREKGFIEDAKRLYLEAKNTAVEEERLGYMGPAAEGAIEDLENAPQCSRARHNYLAYRISHLYTKAAYLHYEQKDYAAAQKLYSEIMEIARAFGFDNLDVYRTETALVELKLREKKTSHEMLAEIKHLKDQNRLLKFIRSYAPMVSDENFYSIPPETYAQYLLLRSCRDVSAVRMVLYTRTSLAGTDAKTLRSHYLVMYRTEKGWQVIDNDRAIFSAAAANFLPGSANEVLRRMESLDGFRLYSADLGERIFADSLREHYKGIDPYYLALRLEEMRLSDQAIKMVRSLNINLSGNKGRQEKTLSLARAFSILPPAYFEGLKRIDFDSISDENHCGEYNNHLKQINLACSGSKTAVHELAHHHDIGVLRGSGGVDLADGDPSLLFYRISWSKFDPVGCADPDFPCNWEKRPDAGSNDFADLYGMTDGLEDLATFAEAYVEDGKTARKKARDGLQKGNFEPALKYLFVKYVLSFDQRDGRCFEYDLGPDDPPLTFAEVKAAAKKRQRDTALIDEIETRYHLHKKK